MRDKEQAELDNYFAAISLKKQINGGNGATSQKNGLTQPSLQQASNQSRREIN